MKQEVQNKIDEINNMLSLDFADLQTFKDMQRSFELRQPVIISGSYVELVERTNEYMRFDVEINPGECYDEHWHDCLEICTVKSGTMNDLLLATAFARKGEKIEYPPLVKHMPHNCGKDMLRLTVEFFKNKF